MKFNWTTGAVLIFIVLLVWAGYSRADEDYTKHNYDGFRIGVGRTVANSEVAQGEIGAEYKNFELSMTIFGQGSTKNGHQSANHFYSVSYLTRPQNFRTENVQPYLRLGVAKNDGSPLVGRETFRLGLGIDFSDIWQLEYGHYSSSGIYRPNRGVDWIMVRYKMPFPW